MQVKKQQLELDMQQQTGSKSGKEYVKAVYGHPTCLTFIQITWCKTARWSQNAIYNSDRISIISNMQMMPLNGREWRRTKEPLDEGERGEWKRVNVGLKLNIRTTKIMASGPITSWQIESGNSNRFYFLVLQNHFRQWLQPWNSKMLAPWHKSCDKPRLCIKKQRHYFADNGPSSQSYGFSHSHVWMWQFSL